MKVVVHHRRAREICEPLQRRFPGLEFEATDRDDALREQVADTDVLLAWQFPRDVLGMAQRLRWLQLTSAGIDQVRGCEPDLRGVVVTNGRGLHAPIMADYVVASLLLLQWNFPQYLRDQAARQWSPRHTLPLAGQILGVIGLGAIGQEIVQRAVCLGMDVVGVRRRPAPVKGVRTVYGPEQLDRMLPGCDFVVLVVPATPETYGMIGDAELGAMKPTAFLINVSRGTVLDEGALLRALKSGTIAGAMLDVFESEPLRADSELWALDNVVVTPHVAGLPADYVQRVAELFGDNLEHWLKDEPLRNVVDLDRGY